jgi:hypothetical protein
MKGERAASVGGLFHSRVAYFGQYPSSRPATTTASPSSSRRMPQASAHREQHRQSISDPEPNLLLGCWHPLSGVSGQHRHRHPVMMRVQLGILAAPEVAVTFLQIVRSGLKPRPEAVATKRCHRPEMVMNEIAPGRDWFAWKGGELQCLDHGLLPCLCIHPRTAPTAVFDQDQKAGTGQAGSDRRRTAGSAHRQRQATGRRQGARPEERRTARRQRYTGPTRASAPSRLDATRPGPWSLALGRQQRRILHRSL